MSRNLLEVTKELSEARQKVTALEEEFAALKVDLPTESLRAREAIEAVTAVLKMGTAQRENKFFYGAACEELKKLRDATNDFIGEVHNGWVSSRDC